MRDYLDALGWLVLAAFGGCLIPLFALAIGLGGAAWLFCLFVGFC